jgi:DNA-binding NarL/FixJ family response regulator
VSQRPRVRSRCEAHASDEQLPLPLGLTVEAIDVAGQTLVVFAFPAASDLPGLLTEAEKIVVTFILQGLTTRQIAAARGVAKSTVLSQLQSIYRKLGIGSRAELACKLG